MKPHINFAFDLGTTSIGWSAITDGQKIIDAGVYLFTDPANPKNGKSYSAERRQFRQQKRLKQRLANRIRDFEKLVTSQLRWVTPQQFTEIKNTPDFLKTYLKSTQQKISKPELVRVILRLLRHRGFFFSETPMAVLPTGKTPAQLLSEQHLNNGFIRNSDLAKQIPHQKYADELASILKTQEIPDAESAEILEIFNRWRNYAFGPGSPISPSKYGLYRQTKSGEIIKIGDNLWDVRIGQCSVYPEEKRGLKNAPLTELANLFSDLNNLKVNDLPLTKDEKELIITKINNQENVNITLLKNIFGKDADFSGYRVDKDNKPLFTQLKNAKTIYQALAPDISGTLIDNLETLNEVFVLAAKYRLPHEFSAHLLALYPNFKDADVLRQALTGLSDTSSLSFKALKEYVDNFLNTEENISTFFLKTRTNNAKLTPQAQLDVFKFNDSYLSPTIKKAVRLCLQLLNALLKFYSKNYEIGTISVELPRDLNSAAERQRLDKLNKTNSKILAEIAADLGLTGPQSWNYALKTKLKLWYQQNKVDPYDLQPISGFDVLKNPQNYQIDHILPFKISGDDSLNNKVLTKTAHNQFKKEQTPYQAFGQDKAFWASFKKYVKDNENFSAVKQDHLISTKDPLKTQAEFINRQFTDTAGISKTVFNYLQSFFDKNPFYPDAEIRFLNGALTNYARYNFFKLRKDRNDFHHHAVDSLIINYFATRAELKDLIARAYLYDKYTGRYFKNHTDSGTTFSFSQIYQFDDNARNFEAQINEWVSEEKIHFRRQIITHIGGELANESLYGVKPVNDTTIQTVNCLNLLTASRDTLKNYFQESNEAPKWAGRMLNRELYQQANKIYRQGVAGILKHNLGKTANPFLYDEKSGQIDLSRRYIILADGRKIRRLKHIVDEKKPTNNCLFSQDGKSTQTSLKPYGFFIYKNNEKAQIIGINAKILSQRNGGRYKVDQTKLAQIVKNNGFAEADLLMRVNDGTLFLDKNGEFVYTTGGGTFSDGKLEIKYLKKATEKQTIVTIKKFVNEYKYVETDVFGRIRKIVALNDLVA